MPDELQPVAPENTPQGVPPQAPASSTPEPPKPETPAYLTREEAGTLFQEQFHRLSPELAQQVRQALAQDFATKTEVSKSSQSAADKTYAKMMRQLAPEMRGIDKAVKGGFMDAEQARQAKLDMFTNAATTMDAEEEHPTAPAPAPQPASTSAPVPDLRQETQRAAQRILVKAGLTWDTVREDMYRFRSSQGRDMGLDEFAEFVAGKMVEKGIQGRETEWMKKYEEKTGKVKNADANGATTPPLQGAAPEYKPKPTLDDANDIGEVLAERFGYPKQ